jgi:rhomboid protease GluP
VSEPAAAVPERTFFAPRFVVTPVLVAINAAVFIWMVAAGASLASPTPEQVVRFGGDFGPYTLTGDYWRLLTSNYVHIGIVHIALNMWCLWGLGRLTEAFYRPLDYLLLYSFTGIASSLLSVGLKPLRASAGASGAIFGIAGVMLATLKWGDIPVSNEGRKIMLGGVARFAGINLLYGLVGARIDNAGHIGGLIAGLAVGAAMCRRLSSSEDDRNYRRFVWLSLWALLAAASVLVVRHWAPEMQRLLR